MRNSTRWIAFLLCALILCGCGKKEATASVEADAQKDYVIATVNGEDLMRSRYEPFKQQYVESFEAMGLSLSDGEAMAYIDDSALTECIQDMLLQQDMKAQGCYEFSEALEAWFLDSGKQAYETALLDVGEYLRQTLGLSEEEDMTEAALSYASGMGVTEADYSNVYREQYALSTYYSWLMRDCPITDEDILSTYEENVQQSQELYADDIQAFETAIAGNESVWYQPEGYRSVLQILLRAEGSSDEEKLAAVSATVSRIYERLNAGESFAALVREYGVDTNFTNDESLATGYSVHPNSVVWDAAFVQAAFSEELNTPGTWSAKPFVSNAGVHILYYLKDKPGGPVDLSDELKDAISYTLYQERLSKCYSERMEELSNAAEVVFPT